MNTDTPLTPGHPLTDGAVRCPVCNEPFQVGQHVMLAPLVSAAAGISAESAFMHPACESSRWSTFGWSVSTTAGLECILQPDAEQRLSSMDMCRMILSAGFKVHFHSEHTIILGV